MYKHVSLRHMCHLMPTSKYNDKTPLFIHPYLRERNPSTLAWGVMALEVIPLWELFPLMSLFAANKVYFATTLPGVFYCDSPRSKLILVQLHYQSHRKRKEKKKTYMGVVWITIWQQITQAKWNVQIPGNTQITKEI